MALSVSFTVTQSIDGKTITFTDTSKYGDGGTDDKSQFTSRTLKVYTGADINDYQSVDWPFDNTNDSIQDTKSIAVTEDHAYSVVLTVSDGSNDYEATNSFVTSQFVFLNELAISAKINPCNNASFSGVGKSLIKIKEYKDFAKTRGQLGDIEGAETCISRAFEISKLYI